MRTRKNYCSSSWLRKVIAAAVAEDWDSGQAVAAPAVGVAQPGAAEREAAEVCGMPESRELPEPPEVAPAALRELVEAAELAGDRARAPAEVGPAAEAELAAPVVGAEDLAGLAAEGVKQDPAVARVAAPEGLVAAVGPAAEHPPNLENGYRPRRCSREVCWAECPACRRELRARVPAGVVLRSPKTTCAR